MDVQVNWIGVLGAAVASMVVGMIWYGPLFGARWQKLVKLTDKDMKEDAGKAIAMAFALSLLTAYVLAHVAYLSHYFFDNSFLEDSLMTAFWLWLGIAFTRTLTHDAFERRPMDLTVMNAGNQLVTLLAMGLVIGLVGL